MLRRDRLRGGSEQEKAQYEAPHAPERAPFGEGVEGSSPHPSLERQGEGRGAYSVLRVDVPKWQVFPRYAPTYSIYTYHDRLVIPRPAQDLRNLLLTEYHDNVGHPN